MSLHPQASALLKMMESNGMPALEEQSPQDARQMYIQSSQILAKPVKVVHTEDRLIKGYEGDILIRIYSPEGDGPKPALVYYHGGGWVIGNIETHDALCHSLAAISECKVISVDYSLAPESKFPVAVEDAYLAVQWASDNASELNIDKSSLAVGGDSAGGNLAAAVCYMAIDRKGPSIAYQMLFYPSTGFELTDSYVKYSEGYYLNKSTMEWFRAQYLNNVEDTKNPLAAPMLIPEAETALLPPAYIVTAEYDPLSDGGEAFSRKLKDAGVEVKYVCYSGMIHGFFCMTEVLEDGKKAVENAALELKAHFAKVKDTTL
ncbi:alpha/beta hydrolase [Mesobacillus harenae]|uniref:alpha/beta hydrolase n=1 Tax=Mesobacillus harenae TaxID=2213203 RepID=UPI0015812B46|nr:alpha/beta hydrolase [Mesobacillus harenae]